MATDSSLLAEIERDVLDGRPLADLLRKCIMLGGRSGSQDLRDWASKELRGYQGDTDLPPYRSVSAPILIDAMTGNSWVKGQSVPESGLPDFVRDAGLGNSVDLRQGVGELEALVQQGQSSDHSIRVSLPAAEIIGDRGIHLTGVKRRLSLWIQSPWPGLTTQRPPVSSWRGSQPTRTAWTTWSGCGGRAGLSAPTVVMPGAGGWVTAGSSAPAAAAVPRSQRARSSTGPARR